MTVAESSSKQSRDSNLGSAIRPITLEDLAGLEEHLEKVMDIVRETGFAPSSSKTAPKFNVTALATLCGKSATAMARLLERAESLNLPTGLAADSTSTRKSFTQAEVVKWVRAVGGHYKREVGTPGCVIAVGNFKGGVGKTVIAMSLAQALSLKGYRVLCIDLDPQGSLTSLMDVDRAGVEDSQTFLPLTTHPQDASHRDTLEESIQETYWSGVDIVAGSSALFAGEFYLPMRQMRAHTDEPGFRFMEVLDRALDKGLKQEYDFIVIDTPPALSYVTLNAYWAADGILMPLPPEGLDIMSSARFWSMFGELSQTAARDATKPKTFSWISVVPSMVDHSKGFTKTNLRVLQTAYDKYLVGNCEVPFSAAVSVSGMQMGTVYDLEKYAGAAKTYERARIAFDRLADEVDYITRLRKWMQTPDEIQKDLQRGKVKSQGA